GCAFRAGTHRDRSGRAPPRRSTSPRTTGRDRYPSRGTRSRSRDRTTARCRAGGCGRRATGPPPASARAARCSWHVVGGDGLALEVLVEPAHDVLQPLHAVPRLARAAELVGLLGEAHHHRRLLEELEGAEHLLAAVGGRSAVVG